MFFENRVRSRVPEHRVSRRKSPTVFLRFPTIRVAAAVHATTARRHAFGYGRTYSDIRTRPGRVPTRYSKRKKKPEIEVVVADENAISVRADRKFHVPPSAVGRTNFVCLFFVFFFQRFQNYYYILIKR